MNLLHELPLRDHDGHVHVVVEVPRGSHVKLKYDEQLGVFTWSRALSLGVSFPYDFGFLPQTVAGDGDALDAMVLSAVPSHPGVVIKTRPVAALRVEQTRDQQPAKRNDRLLMVPVNAHRQNQMQNIGDIPGRVLDEIQAFCEVSLVLTGKHVRFCGWADATETADIIAQAHRRYREREDGS